MPYMSCRRRLTLLALVFWTSIAHGQQKRPLAVDDLLALEQLGSVAPSPDGEWIAVVIARAMTNAETYRDFAFGRDRADIWLVERRSGHRRNITMGSADGSGYWNPVWSPDGTRLAMLSTKGGDDIRPFVYELASGRLQRVTGRGVDLQAIGDDGWPAYGMVWRDNATLLCPVRADSAPPPSYFLTRVLSSAIAERGWAKAMKGVESTASVLESGREVPAAERAQGALLAIDIDSRTSRVLVNGNIRRMLVSPTRRHVALIFETTRIPPRPARRLRFVPRPNDLVRTRMAIMALDRDATVAWVNDVIDPELTTGAGGPHSWSPDGLWLAVVGKSMPDDENATALSLVATATGVTRGIGRHAFDVTATTWSTGGDLIVLARPRSHATGSADTLRFDWWAVDLRVPEYARNLTAGSDAVPAATFRTPDRHTVAGVALGRLWMIDVRAGTVSGMPPSQPSLTAVVWPATPPDDHQQDVIVVAGQGQQLYRITWDRGVPHMTVVPRPSAASRLAVFRPEQRLAVFTSTERTGTYLWTGDSRSDQFERQLALNEHLRDIDDAQRLLITYRGTDGDTLNGLLILPLGYRPGERYPLVTSVYAGLVVTDTVLSLYPGFEKEYPSSENLHLLPAHGYAVLVPSIPLGPSEESSDPWIDLPKGVMAAVDKVIDMGIADPERLGVMGHSFGGYSTYALVTYTHRFKAAIATAGLADLVSTYGTLYPPLRYDEYAQEELLLSTLVESGQGRMGAPPWGNLWRYLRNSPLYFVDRVRTPIMIVQGDIDFVPIQQGEEFFTALYRQGKEAVFVRYWGEGHVISSPANVRDLWQRRYAWFDKHLQPHTPPAAGSVSSATGLQ